MAGLRLYEPATEDRFAEEESPDVISLERFVTRRNRIGTRLTFTDAVAASTPLSRARALHKNRICKFCSHPVVDPVVLNDGLRDGSGQYVPGSATLVGFHCDNCHHEWPIFND